MVSCDIPWQARGEGVRHHRGLYLAARGLKTALRTGGPRAAGPAYRGGWVVDPRRGDVMTEPSGDGERRIVVGVDGSASSTDALAWALKQAALTGAVVDAVIAWEVPANYSFLVQVPVDINYAGIAAQVAADAIAEVSGPGEQVKIRSTVAEGSPARVLLDASAGSGAAGGRQPRAWRIRRGPARLGQPALRAPRHVSRRGDPPPSDRILSPWPSIAWPEPAGRERLEGPRVGDVTGGKGY